MFAYLLQSFGCMPQWNEPRSGYSVKDCDSLLKSVAECGNVELMTV